MKLPKNEWKKVIMILLVLLVVLIIYYLNESKEKFQNNNQNNNQNNDDNITGLKTSLAIFSKVQEDRIDNIKINGTLPDIKITYDILPRTIDDTEEKTLDELETILEAYKTSMDYNFVIDGQEHTFIDINIAPYQKGTTTTYQALTDKFVDRGIDKQIQGLKDIQNMVKYSNPMDRFYKFNKNTGDLILEEEIAKNTPIEAESVSGELNSDLSNNNTVDNAVNNTNNNKVDNTIEPFVPYHKRFW